MKLVKLLFYAIFKDTIIFTLNKYKYITLLFNNNINYYL